MLVQHSHLRATSTAPEVCKLNHGSWRNIDIGTARDFDFNLDRIHLVDWLAVRSKLRNHVWRNTRQFRLQTAL